MKLYKRLLLVIIVITIIFTSSTILGDNEEFTSEIQEKLADISKEEMEILEYLFIQVQEIDEMERENIRLNHEIEIMGIDIETLEDRIIIEESNYKQNLMALESILKSYQRMGAASYLEIILDSDSLTSLIRRINILRDLTKNTGELLLTIEKTKENLIAEKTNLDNKIKSLEDKRLVLRESLIKKQKLVAEKEEYLASLGTERDKYMERLDYVEMMMVDLKQILTDFTREFTKIIRDGNLPTDAVEESLTLRGIKGRISEKVFNDIIGSYKELPKMEIRFYPGKIEMSAPEKQLILIGEFVIIDDQTLKFEAEKGSFYGMSLEKSTIDELFSEGDFVLELEPLLGKNILRSVEIKDKIIEILVGIKFF